MLNLCVYLICIPATVFKIRTFLRKNDSYLEKYKFAKCFKGFKLKHFEQQ